MSNDQSPIEKVGNNIGKWILGTISAITAIVSFVNLMRGNFKLGLLIFEALIVANLFLLLLYIIFYTKPASAKSKKRIYPYEKYRKAAIAGVVILPIVVVGALSMRSNRDFIVTAVQGTPTATATATSTALPPETTMLVTVKEGYPCLVDSMGVFNNVTRKDTLDIGINNNSDRDLMITSATLKPIWITTDQWMGPTPITATYDVSLDGWWNESELLVMSIYETEGYLTPLPDAHERVAQVGWMRWTKPSPIEVKEITGDKFTVKRNSQDRFEIVLGLSETNQSMWGSLIVELTTDNNQTLTSEPIQFAVCYEQTPISNTPSETLESVIQNPAANRDGMTWFAWNDAAKQDSGGVVIEITRIVIAENSKGLDFASDPMGFYEDITVGEIFFKIQNNTDKQQLVLPIQMDFKINRPADFQYAPLTGGIGQNLNGYIEPGETKIGSLQFSTMDFTPAEIKSLQMDFGCAFNDLAGCSGAEFKFDIDLPAPANDPLPEAIRKFLLP